MKPQKPKPEVIIDIESLSHDGRGIANINGKTSFIHGALPGEKIKAKLTKQHSRYNEGETLEVIQASDIRVTPECKHFSICGGCSMQHMSIDSQLNLKQKTLIEQLRHFGNVTPLEVLPALSGKPWGYRRKARLGVRYVKKKERVLIGFREKSSNFLADIEICPVLHPAVGTKLTLLSELIQSLSQFDQIPQIEVAVSPNETSLVFRHMQSLSETDIEKLCEFGKAHDFHIYLQPNSPKNIQKIWPQNSAENLQYTLKDYQLTLEFQPLDFIQINDEINQQMLHQALQLLDLSNNDNVLDLFCGLGNFTFPISRFAKEVTGVEGSSDMIERAKKNAELNHINNIDFYVENLQIPKLDSAWRKKSYDKILLDPPRSGAKELLDSFDNLSAKRIVYVSCNPATLARDAGKLVYTFKYKLKKAGIINMFPHTSHIESIALFEK